MADYRGSTMGIFSMAQPTTQVQDCSNLDDAELVARCNMMMAAAGLVAKAQTANDAKAICSSTSVFVAAFEQLTGHRIEGVQRSPTGIADRVENCHRVIQETGKLFKLDLSHLSAEKVVLGDANQIASLLELVIAIPKRRPRVAAERETRKDWRESRDLEKMEGGKMWNGDGRKRRSGEKHALSRGPVRRGSEHSCSESDNSISDGRTDDGTDFQTGRKVPNVSRQNGTASQLEGQLAERPVRNTRFDRSNARAHSASTDSDSSKKDAATPTSRDTDIDTDSAKSFSSCSDSPVRPTHRAAIPGFRTGVNFASSRGPRRLESHAARKHGHPPNTSIPPADDVIHGRHNDVSRVLSLVERVAAQEQREWDEKQQRFKREFTTMSRRAYAPRWPFRPMPDLQDVQRVPNQGWQLAWRRKEDERLRKRRKRLVQLRPQGGRQGVAGLARCWKAYRSVLPNGQVPLRLRTQRKATGRTNGANRLFSKETLKQLDDVVLSPNSVLDSAPGQNLQTLLRKNPRLRDILVRPQGTDHQPKELVRDLVANPGLRKGLARKFAGLEALRSEARVKRKPSEVNGETMWRQMEVWAEGIVSRSRPTVRDAAHAKLQDQLESHQQRTQQIQAARFKEEVMADQKAAAVKRAEAEEQLFKTLLERAISLEKEAILAQRKEEREQQLAAQRNQQAERERAEEEIRGRCALLKEEIGAKRRERMEIERAQQQMMRQLAREERERLELERAMLLERLALQSR